MKVHTAVITIGPLQVVLFSEPAVVVVQHVRPGLAKCRPVVVTQGKAVGG